MGRSQAPSLTSLFIALLMLVGCSTSSVDVLVQYPARVPVSVFPTVFLVATGAPEAHLVLEAMRGVLRGQDVEVRELSLGELEAGLRARSLPAASAAIVVDAQLVESMSFRSPQGMQGCPGGPGCINGTGMLAQMTSVQARTTMSVYDASTGALLQRESGQFQEESGDAMFVRDRALIQVVQWAEETITAPRKTRAVAFYRVDTEENRRAIAAFRTGDHAQACTLFELAVLRGAPAPSERSQLNTNFVRALVWSQHGTLADRRERIERALSRIDGAHADDADSALREEARARLSDLQALIRQDEARASYRARATRDALGEPPDSYRTTELP